MSIIGKLNERYPKWPTFLANTAASKITQLVKKKVLDPAFANEQIAGKIQSWPPAVKKTAEWILYLLSSVVRTMPNQEHPVAGMLKEALEDTLTQAGIKINDVPEAEQAKIINTAMPVIHDQLVEAVKEDHQFREWLSAVLGTVQDWDKIIHEAENSVSCLNEKTQTHREARKARGWRRFL